MNAENEPAAPLLALDGVTKDYDMGAGAPVLRVLQGVSLRLGAKESMAILGPSGSGKSTLLNIIGTLDVPTEGRVAFDGRDLGGMGESERAAFRNRSIGFVFQLHHLLAHLTCFENVLVPTLGRRSEKTVRERACDLLARVGLGERLGHFPGELSGGERQRVAVVRALINEPELLLADEPTGALDRASADALIDLLLELNRTEGTALIVVTHAENLAARMGSVMELRDGVLSPWKGRP